MTDPAQFNPWAAGFNAAAQAAAGGPSAASLWGGESAAHMDGAGWTVSTGKATAEGGTVSKQGPAGAIGEGMRAAMSSAVDIGGVKVPTVGLLVVGLLGLALLMRRS